MLGRLRCLDALGEHRKVLESSMELWRNLQVSEQAQARGQQTGIPRRKNLLPWFSISCLLSTLVLLCFAFDVTCATPRLASILLMELKADTRDR